MKFNDLNKKILFKTIFFVITFSIVFFATKHITSYLTSTEGVLKEVSSKLNSKCPYMINSEIRLDKTNVISFQNNFGLVYVCTLINEDKSYEKSNLLLLDQKTKFVAQKNYDSNPELEYLRENDLTIYYVCYDKNNLNLLGFEINNQKNITKK